jgi:hypothetical protein
MKRMLDQTRHRDPLDPHEGQMASSRPAPMDSLLPKLAQNPQLLQLVEEILAERSLRLQRRKAQRQRRRQSLRHRVGLRLAKLSGLLCLLRPAPKSPSENKISPN